MPNDGYQVRIERDPYKDETCVYIYRREFSGKAIVLEASANSEYLESHEIGEAESGKPALRLPSMIADEVFQAIADALADRNIKTDKDAKIEGTLEATRYHLEDMRRLLKLPEGAK